MTKLRWNLKKFPTINSRMSMTRYVMITPKYSLLLNTCSIPFLRNAASRVKASDFDQEWNVESKNQQKGNNRPKQSQHKEFSVKIPNASRKPRTMMVHSQNAPLASRAVVASFGLEQVAYQTVALAPVLRLVHVKSLMSKPRKRAEDPGRPTSWPRWTRPS